MLPHCPALLPLCSVALLLLSADFGQINDDDDDELDNFSLSLYTL